MNFPEMVEFDKELIVGQKVLVRWGYGSGFRAEGCGTITKLFRKSCRVRLDNDVKLNGTVGWKADVELKSIPRCQYENINNWNWELGVFPREKVTA